MLVVFSYLRQMCSSKLASFCLPWQSEKHNLGSSTKTFEARPIMRANVVSFARAAERVSPLLMKSPFL